MRRPAPHHRPTSDVFAEPTVTIVRRDSEDPAAWRDLVGLLVGLVDTSEPQREAS